VYDAADAGMTGVFMELGAAVIGLALLARLAHRLGFSAIPLYLLGRGPRPAEEDEGRTATGG
jgi:hypothetical protein